MDNRKITTIPDLIAYVKENSPWQTATIRQVITALGYNPNAGWESLIELSGSLADCAKHGADGGFPGFIYHRETIAFFLHNRKDIVNNLLGTAAELGEDVIKLVQNFGVFRYSTPAQLHAPEPVRALLGIISHGVGLYKCRDMRKIIKPPSRRGSRQSPMGYRQTTGQSHLPLQCVCLVLFRRNLPYLV